MMAITITLDDDLVADLACRAKTQHLSVEQVAISILTAAMQESQSVTAGAPVTRTQAAPPSPAQFRPASANLADLLGAAPSDPSFDLESWQRQWSSVEAELKAITSVTRNTQDSTVTDRK